MAALLDFTDHAGYDEDTNLLQRISKGIVRRRLVSNWLASFPCQQFDNPWPFREETPCIMDEMYKIGLPHSVLLHLNSQRFYIIFKGALKMDFIESSLQSSHIKILVR